MPSARTSQAGIAEVIIVAGSDGERDAHEVRPLLALGLNHIQISAAASGRRDPLRAIRWRSDVDFGEKIADHVDAGKQNSALAQVGPSRLQISARAWSGRSPPARRRAPCWSANRRLPESG